jgi:hypothetical protein
MLEGPLIEANILPKLGSDHWPVQLWMDMIATPKLKPFHFEKFWINHPDFPELSVPGGPMQKSHMAQGCTDSNSA